MSSEVECLDNMILAQFVIKACIKLRDSTSVGIETGQYSYLKLLLLDFFVLCLDVLLVKTCENVISDIESRVCCNHRGSA